jgi:hypothetical protein
LRAAATAVVDPVKFLLERFGLGSVLARRHLADGCLQVAEHFDHAGVVLAMERGQLIEDVVSALDTRMAEYLPAGHHLKGDAAQA